MITLLSLTSTHGCILHKKSCLYAFLISFHIIHLEKVIGNIQRKSQKYSKKISSVTPDHTLSELFSLFSTLLNDNSEGIPLDSLKDKISEKIRNSNRRYVVTIDDLDHLDPTEILMVFKLVRSVANFSNVIYILCYDDTIVRNALTTESYSGQEYLQKIINVPIRLPEHSPDISIQHLVNVYSDLVRRTILNDYEIGMVVYP